MEILEFLIGEEQLPIYRTVHDSESEILRALLGAGFCFELRDGEPIDELLFDVLAGVGMRADFFFSPPEGASILGTFEVVDAAIPAPTFELHRSRPRVH
jgi:hypothetical protein